MLGLYPTRLAALVLPVLSLVGASHIRPLHKRHQNPKRNFDLIAERDVELRADQSPVERSGQLVKRETYSGDGTYFYVGLGACGQNSQDSDLMVALNYQQYGDGYPGPQCFKYITVQANGITVGGIEILDECPSCPNVGDLDMSPGLFQKFVPGEDIAVIGEIQITWWFDDDSSSSSTTTSSTSKWVAPTSTYTPASSTSTWEAPTSTWTPASSTSTWVAPSSTWTPTSTSTWVAPSTSTWVESSSSTWSSSSSWWTSSSTTSSSSTSTTSTTNNTSVNPYVATSSYSPIASASSSSNSTSDGTTDSSSTTSAYVGNLEAINGLVTNYGQIVVLAAGGQVS